MSSSRGGSSQGGRGRGDRQGGGSRLQPGAFDGLSDGDSMSNSGTNFTLPQAGSGITSAPSTQPTRSGRGGRTVTTGPSFSDVGGGAGFVFDDDDDEGYEMPTLDDAQKESSAATAKGRATTAAAADAAGSAVGSDRVGGATPTLSRLASVLAHSNIDGSALSAGGVTFVLPDVTTATGAMFSEMKEEDFDKVFAQKYLKAAKTAMYDEKPQQQQAMEYSFEHQRGGMKALEGMRDELLPSERAQSTGQALARRVLERFRLAQEKGLDFAPAVGNLGIRRFRNAVRMVIQQGKRRSPHQMRMHPRPMSYGPQRGYVLVEKQLNEDGTHGAATVWKYFVQDEEHATDQLMFVARKDYSNMLKSQFIVGTNPLEIVDFGANFIGRLIGNFMGSRYTMFDNGIKLTPKQRQINESKEDAEKEKEKALGGGEERNVMGSVQFEGTVTKKSGGYQRSTIVLPGTYDDYFGRLKHKKWDDLDDIRDIHVLTTKVPTYKKINGQWVYCYKWGGRVRMPSQRNFQLVLHGDANATVMMFGKTDEGLYALDYCYPLSAFQAFCLALTSFDRKLCMLI